MPELSPYRTVFTRLSNPQDRAHPASHVAGDLLPSQTSSAQFRDSPRIDDPPESSAERCKGHAGLDA